MCVNSALVSRQNFRVERWSGICVYAGNCYIVRWNAMHRSVNSWNQRVVIRFFFCESEWRHTNTESSTIKDFLDASGLGVVEIVSGLYTPEIHFHLPSWLDSFFVAVFHIIL